MTGNREQEAIRADAEQRLAELRAVARALWPSRDDPEVLSELVNVMNQIRAAECALR
jgi:hypothetical protein